eukprot:4376067-Lingulodinium_polyedra.AAC.1
MGKGCPTSAKQLNASSVELRSPVHPDLGHLPAPGGQPALAWQHAQRATLRLGRPAPCTSAARSAPASGRPTPPAPGSKHSNSRACKG